MHIKSCQDAEPVIPTSFPAKQWKLANIRPEGWADAILFEKYICRKLQNYYF